MDRPLRPRSAPRSLTRSHRRNASLERRYVEPQLTIEDESVALTNRAIIDFQGPGVTATDDATNGKTVVTIPGTAGAVVNGPSVEIAQLSHGFVVGDVLRLDPTAVLEQVAFVASAQTTDPTVVSGSRVADIPPGLQAGDVLYLKVDWINQFVGLDNSAAASGFTSIDVRRMDNFGIQVLRRVLDGSEAYIGTGGTVSVSMSGTDATHNQIACFAVGYRGVNNASPEETVVGSSTTDATTDGYADTYTTTTDGQVIIQALFLQPITTDFAPAAPAGTLRQNRTDWAAPWTTARSVWHESDTILAASGQAVEMDWSNAEYGATIFGLKHAGTGSPYVKAQADSAADAEVVGIVTEVIDADHFIMTLEGRITGLSGLSGGEVYFLDPATAGALTTTEPTGLGEVSKPLLIADTPTSGYFFNWRGEIIGDTPPDNDGSSFAATGGGGGASGLTQSYVGYNTVGGTTDGLTSTGYKSIYKKITPAADGLLASIDAYIKGNGSNVAALGVFVCADNAGVPGNIIAASGDIATVTGTGVVGYLANLFISTTARWISIPISAWLTGGTDYWICIVYGSGASAHYDGSGGDYTVTPNTSWAGDGSKASPTNSSRTYSIRGNLIS